MDESSAKTRFTVSIPDKDPVIFSVDRVFEFESSLQRMSVFTRQLDGTTVAYIKGSPEMIRSLSKPSSVPASFELELKLLTQKGFRVIAYAIKHMPNAISETLKREQCESDIEFLGLVWMENQVKEATQGVISTLKENNINVMMATGDNILTAISVG